MKKLYLFFSSTLLTVSSFAQIEVFSGGAVSVGSTTAPTAGYELQLTGKSLFSSNVGIGNTNPGALLDVGTTGGTTYGRFSAAQIGYIGQSGAGFCLSGNSSTGYAILQHSNTNTYFNAASGGTIVFRLNNTDMAYINSNGINIGSQTSYQLSLSVNSATKPTSSTWTITSDSKTKRNVATYSHGLDLIRKVKLISYEYNGLANTPIGEKGIGVIAQDFQNVFPNSVKSFTIKADSTHTGGTFLSVDLHELFVSNVGAVQQLDSIVSAQAAIILKQDSINKALQAQITACCNKRSLINVGSDGGTGGTNSNFGDIKNRNISSSPDALLFQNAPNPFNVQTSIQYYIPTTSKNANVMIFDLQGKSIKTIAVTSFGSNSIIINGNELSPGMFVYSLIVDGAIVDTKRMILTQ
jgi:hypothetical protein